MSRKRHRKVTPPAQAASQPSVSICTITYNRAAFLPLLQACVASQTYPHRLIEWVIVDDSDNGEPPLAADPKLDIRVRHVQLAKRLMLGHKRNLSHEHCTGEIIVYMDDDDYYPPQRVQHAVERLCTSEELIAGSTLLPILLLPEKELWLAGPYGKNHATAGTFAFKRQLLECTSYNEDSKSAEEKEFLKNYTIPMVQLQPQQTIICIGHNNNTFGKRKLKIANNEKIRQITSSSAEDRALIDRIATNYSHPILLQPLAVSERQTIANALPNPQPSRTTITHSIPKPADEIVGEALHFKIIIPVYNGAAYIKQCIESIRAQTHCNYQAIVVDDGSTDNTAHVAEKAIDGDPRFKLIRCSENSGSPLNSFMRGVQLLKPNPQDILVTVDGDDSLYGNDALQVVAYTYATKHCLLTYGSFLRVSDKAILGSPYDTRIVMSNAFRKASWKASHLRTFMAGLLELVDPRELKDAEGSFVKQAGDIALMHPLLEIAAHRSECITTPLYVYNDTSPSSEHRIDHFQHANTSRSIRALTPFAPAPFIALSSHPPSRQEKTSWPQQDLVSVIIPTKNRESHLLAAIHYFQAQTWPNKELIILDDSETDSHKVKCAADSDPRIHYIYQSESITISGKRKLLCGLAKGSYIVHFDDDDYYSPTYIERMLAAMIGRDLDFIKLRSWCNYHTSIKVYGFCNVALLDRTRFYRISSQRVERFPRPFTAQEIHNSLYGYGFSYVYKKSALAQANHADNINFGSDIQFANDCLAKGVRIGFHDDLEGLAVHIIHSGNISSCFAQHLMQEATLSKITTIKPLPSGALGE